MLAYLESSAIDAACRAKITPGQLRDALQIYDAEPVTGHLTLHELARPLVSGRPEITKELCSFLEELDPGYHQPTPELIRQELAFFRAGRPVEPDLDPANRMVTEAEVRGLRHGQISPELRSMILERAEGKKTDWVQSTERYLAGTTALRRKTPSAIPKFSSFAQVEAFFQTALDRFVAQACIEPISETESKILASRLTIYPALRAHVYYWLYLCFICLSSKVRPAHDRLDDFRHAIEASYCHFFVSNDDALLRALPVLAPSLRPVPWLALKGPAA